jgi:multidrug efflux pump subunit AcrA (membrane-fusion protein)
MPQSTISQPIDELQQNAVVVSTQQVIASRDLDGEAANACAALELVSCMVEAVTFDAACVTLVNRLKAFLNADGVALGLVRSGGRTCRLTAIAGAADVNRGSELSVVVEQALGAVVADDENGGSIVPSTETVAGLQELLGGPSIEKCPLTTSAGKVTGAILIWGRAGELDSQRAERFLKTASEPLAGALAVVERAQAGRLRRSLGRFFGNRRWAPWAAVVAAVLCIAALLPYRIECVCAAEPLKRRFVAAPFAGVFEKSLVRPGDLVTEGAILGRMDGRELALELAALSADYERTRKSHDVNLAAAKVAAAQIDKLELERLEEQRKLLNHRMAHVEIRSPVAGYVISGDMEQTEGAPLTLGQSLYEIAPLDQMIVEVEIDDDEVAKVREGQAASVGFEAHRGETFDGTIARIYPRAEIRESRNVFIAEVTLSDSQAALRPGMKGTARIAVEGESLLVGLLTRLWSALAGIFGF